MAKSDQVDLDELEKPTAMSEEEELRTREEHRDCKPDCGFRLLLAEVDRLRESAEIESAVRYADEVAALRAQLAAIADAVGHQEGDDLVASVVTAQREADLHARSEEEMREQLAEVTEERDDLSRRMVAIVEGEQGRTIDTVKGLMECVKAAERERDEAILEAHKVRRSEEHWRTLRAQSERKRNNLRELAQGQRAKIRELRAERDRWLDRYRYEATERDREAGVRIESARLQAEAEQELKEERAKLANLRAERRRALERLRWGEDE